MTEPLYPDADTLTRFAADLRALRTAHGNATLETLARMTGVSKSVLSDAFAGKKLPSERTVTALAHAFGADSDRWTSRRAALDSSSREPGSSKRGARRVPSLVILIPVAIVALAVGAVAGAAGANAVDQNAIARANAKAVAAANAPQIVVKTGEDPANTKCVNDAKVISSETRTHDTQLQIIYSAACHAAWSRVTRYDGQTAGNTVSTAIYRQVDPKGADRQSTTEPAQSAYTTLIVRPSPKTEICATGSITVSGQSISLGAPLCM